MKKAIVLLSLLLTSLSGFSQGFTMGNNYFSAGYGLEFANSVNVNSSYGGGADVKQDNSSLGPIWLKYERAITDNIGIGGDFGYAQNSIKQTISMSDFNGGTSETTIESDVSAILIVAKGYYHFLLDNEKFDPYASLGLGVGIFSANVDMGSDFDTGTGGSMPSLSADGTSLVYYPAVGARYFFSDNFGAFLELGFGSGSGGTNANAGGYTQLGLVFSFGGY